MTELMQN